MGVYHKWARNKVGRHNHSQYVSVQLNQLNILTVHTVSGSMAYTVSIGFKEYMEQALRN